MERDKALNTLSLARKAGRIEVGEIPVSVAARAGKARLVLVAQDASDHTLRKIRNLVAGTEQPYLKVAYDKDTLGGAVGYSAISVCALTDPALALSFVRALDDRSAQLEALLVERTEKARRRQAEQKAHRANIRRGKKKS